MDRRLTLHAKLLELIGNGNVYFQPPDKLLMKYPCIRYKKSRPSVLHADDMRYFNTTHYELTVISTDPDYDLPDRIADAFPLCSIDRFYTSDNLSHCAIELYY